MLRKVIEKYEDSLLNLTIFLPFKGGFSSKCHTASEGS